jgi:hypothetical protein
MCWRNTSNDSSRAAKPSVAASDPACAVHVRDRLRRAAAAEERVEVRLGLDGVQLGPVERIGAPPSSMRVWSRLESWSKVTTGRRRCA